MPTNRFKYIIGKHNTYRIDEYQILNKGKYSTVYKGISLDTKENVAIKKIYYKLINKNINNNVNNNINNNTVNNNVNNITKFIDREIEIVEMLIINPHEHIVKYHEIIKLKYCVYIVMELCDCGKLSSLLIKPMKEKYIKFYINQILSALHFLKKNEIVHRDFKPDNILLTNKYKILKICDFGFSTKMINMNDEEDILCGSPIYMTPDILNLLNLLNNDVKHTNIINDNNNLSDPDIWAVGIIFYEMIYGQHPCKKLKDMDEICKKLNYINIEKTKYIDIKDNGLQLLKNILNKNQIINFNDVFNNSWLTNVDTINEIILSDLFFKTDIDTNIIVNHDKNFEKMISVDQQDEITNLDKIKSDNTSILFEMDE